ncbi:putative leucine rich repeat only protein 3 [Paratrimastix pyriformis]|uniref:Leucine rich repeat only protein 3 n=1 Tax=Paratrimastix pyriformis TaxID=342808 RepID=A0ABQ8UB57_9EUKA|nr:putative leucine rich repeat only protein 3 [Paratrimastix pyriformis]
MSALSTVLDEYQKRCQEVSIVPCIVFTELIESHIKAGTPLTRVILNGNSKILFNSRINDMQCIAVVDACISAGTVEALDLSRNRITDTGASALGRLIGGTPLRELDVSYNQIGTEGCEHIVQGVQASATLEVLNLAGNPVLNEGAMLVAEMLQMNTTLTRCDLSNCDLATESVIAFATVLLTNTHLLHLGLSNPRLFSLREEPLVHFAAMLRTNSTLQSLDLSKHRIRDEGVRTLCEQLAANDTLRHLSLRCNQITMEGGCAIGRMLEGSHLTTLDLSANRVDDLGAVAIAKALQNNRFLVSLDLTNNSVGEEGLVAFANALPANDTLTRLFLWGNRFTPTAADALGKIFATSRTLTETDLVIYYTDGVAGVAQRNE